MDVGEWIVIGLSVVMAVWFGIGSFYNRRRGIRTYRWIQAGLSQLGKIGEAAWIGSAASGARLVVPQAQTPFRRVETVFLLESREILPLWLFNRLRNKQDEMILKAALRSVPPVELEAAPKSDRQTKALLSAERRPYEQVEAPDGFLIARRGASEVDLERINAFLREYRESIIRLSLQRQVPHLILRVRLPQLEQGPPEAFFEAVSQVVQR